MKDCLTPTAIELKLGFPNREAIYLKRNHESALQMVSFVATYRTSQAYCGATERFCWNKCSIAS